ncbi:hypothetical protein BGZ70_009737 [Mortierella alpina]|uniref:DUF4110 domain-containing protein n=1 Tax=Mortierella alpina TaxID=64518 RepID=A0A9P6J3X4_MORAP|nr:hypothetical protein BGZ70_009737 [Mortierella alpina]
MAKKDKKKKTKEHKAKVAEKQDRKQSKKDKKSKAKNVEEQEEDIETILANFKKEQEEKVKIVEEVWTGPPSRRANATLTANPLNQNELIFFGGEFYDGAKCAFYNDLYRYNIEKDEWRRITSPNSPGPRSSHQVAITPAGTLFLFGGEFASPNETQFFHYKDFWSMDMKTNAWEKLEVKPKPTARSGHRMTQWKNFLVMFGGFYDNYVDTRYYDDLWVFDTLDYKWIKVELPDQMIRPAARSGFSFIPCNEGVILYGGYCKEYTKGQRPKGVVHTDTWLLKMNTDPKLIRWEKKKKSGSAPSARSGCAMAPYKNRAVLFGGVFDDDVNEETLESTFYNELYTYQIDTGRWFPMNLKRPKTAKKKKSRKGNKQAGRVAGSEGQDGADEEGSGKREKMKWEESTDDEFDYGDFEDSENEGDDATTGTAEVSVAGTEEQSGTPKDGGDLSGVATPQEGDDASKDAATEKMSTKEALAAAALAAAGILPKAAQTAEDAAESASTKKALKSGRNARDNHAGDDDEEEEEPLMPCPRYNPMLAVQKSTLFIFGGILEVRDREYTLDDFFSLNLDKMTEYICLRQSEFESQLWLGEDAGASDPTATDAAAAEPGAEGTCGAEGEGAAAAAAAEAEAVVEVVPSQLSGVDLAARLAMTEEETASTPTIGETLKEFYGRTTEYWVLKAFEDSTKTGKALRHDGFLLAEAKFNEWQPILAQMAQMRLEAGLDDEDDDDAAGRMGGRGGVLKMGEVYNKLMSRHRR